MTEKIHKAFLNSAGVERDTRRRLEGKIYWALKGERFDGNRFVKQALEKGAKYAVTSDPKWKNHSSVFVVQDTLKALQDLANFHRKYYGIPVIAITGSNGKTTTKELVRSVLSEKFKVVATEGNLNNHIGVPLTLLEITQDTEVAVVEMGINHFGEMEVLCRIAEPDFGYITSFGEAHLEFFGSLEGVVKAKTELYRFLEKNNGTAFVNYDDAIQVKHTRRVKRFGFTYSGHPDAQVKLVEKARFPFNELVYKNMHIRSKLFGTFHLPNLGAAVCVGDYFGLPPRQIKAGIEKYVPRNNRSQMLTINNLRIILDAYNANPTSMRAALQSLAGLPGQKLAVLGDMFELGEKKVTLHQQIVDLLEELRIPAFLIGKTFKQTVSNPYVKGYFDDVNDFKTHVNLFDYRDATILIKASRGMALERIMEEA